MIPQWLSWDKNPYIYIYMFVDRLKIISQTIEVLAPTSLGPDRRLKVNLFLFFSISTLNYHLLTLQFRVLAFFRGRKSKAAAVLALGSIIRDSPLNANSCGSYLIVKCVTLPHRQPLCQVLQEVRYTIMNCTLDDVFLISLSYTWTTEE